MREIQFTISGLPPAKGEALSMLGPRHPHASRVRALLEAARFALHDGVWQLTGEPIGLELVVYLASDSHRSDATNYLGGIGDVLQDKVRPFRGRDLSHLGELQKVALYEDDSQIREIRYTERSAHAGSYAVRIWTLEGSEADRRIVATQPPQAARQEPSSVAPPVAPSHRARSSCWRDERVETRSDESRSDWSVTKRGAQRVPHRPRWLAGLTYHHARYQ